MPEGGCFLEFYYWLNIAFHQGDPDFVDSEARTRFPKTIRPRLRGHETFLGKGIRSQEGH